MSQIFSGQTFSNLELQVRNWNSTYQILPALSRYLILFFIFDNKNDFISGNIMHKRSSICRMVKKYSSAISCSASKAIFLLFSCQEKASLQNSSYICLSFLFILASSYAQIPFPASDVLKKKESSLCYEQIFVVSYLKIQGPPSYQSSNYLAFGMP